MKQYKYFNLEIRKDLPWKWDKRTHGEYVWKFGKLKGQSAYNTGYSNVGYIIWCYENLKGFEMPQKGFLNFLDGLEANIVTADKQGNIEKVQKYIDFCNSYAKDYLDIITRHENIKLIFEKYETDKE